MTTKFEKLCAGILANSSSSELEFIKARDEWELLFVTKNSVGKCLCGKRITNECDIQNQVTKKMVIVGSSLLTIGFACDKSKSPSRTAATISAPFLILTS